MLGRVREILSRVREILSKNKMDETTMDVGKLVTDPKMLHGVMATTVIALSIINSVAKRVPEVEKFVQEV